jgi:hypothetical protein
MLASMSKVAQIIELSYELIGLHVVYGLVQVNLKTVDNSRPYMGAFDGLILAWKNKFPK